MKVKIAVSYDYFTVPTKYADEYDLIDVAAAIFRQRPAMGVERAKKAADLLLEEIEKNRQDGKPFKLAYVDVPDTGYGQPLYGLKVVGRPSRRVF